MPSILRAGWSGVNPVPEVALAPQLAARVLLGVQAGPQETAGALPFTVQGVHVQEVIAHERARGVEPPSDAWKAPALPLSYTHVVRGRNRRIPRGACRLCISSPRGYSPDRTGDLSLFRRALVPTELSSLMLLFLAGQAFQAFPRPAVEYPDAPAFPALACHYRQSHLCSK